jgi:hypothetical protein
MLDCPKQKQCCSPKTCVSQKNQKQHQQNTTISSSNTAVWIARKHGFLVKTCGCFGTIQHCCVETWVLPRAFAYVLIEFANVRERTNVQSQVTQLPHCPKQNVVFARKNCECPKQLRKPHVFEQYSLSRPGRFPLSGLFESIGFRNDFLDTHRCLVKDKGLLITMKDLSLETLVALRAFTIFSGSNARSIDFTKMSIRNSIEHALEEAQLSLQMLIDFY